MSSYQSGIILCKFINSFYISQLGSVASVRYKYRSLK